MAPRPITDVMTGAASRWASATSSVEAPAAMTPPPATMSGRFAARRRLAASSMSCGSQAGGPHIGGAAARGDHDHARPARRARVAVGHEARALLVAGQYVRDVALADQGIVDGEVVDAGQAEDVPHPLGPQNFHGPLTTGAE